MVMSLDLNVDRMWEVKGNINVHKRGEANRGNINLMKYFSGKQGKMKI